jgi:hypothetical protein
MAAGESKVILQSLDDWEHFDWQFQQEAYLVKLLDYILGKEELTPKPIIPNIDNYKKGCQQSVVVLQ